jgi:hypothetical protein
MTELARSATSPSRKPNLDIAGAERLMSQPHRAITRLVENAAEMPTREEFLAQLRERFPDWSSDQAAPRAARKVKRAVGADETAQNDGDPLSPDRPEGASDPPPPEPPGPPVPSPHHLNRRTGRLLSPSSCSPCNSVNSIATAFDTPPNAVCGFDGMGESGRWTRRLRLRTS